MLPLTEFIPAAASVAAMPLLTAFIAIGTGYGMESDWRHGGAT